MTAQPSPDLFSHPAPLRPDAPGNTPGQGVASQCPRDAAPFIVLPPLRAARAFGPAGPARRNDPPLPTAPGRADISGLIQAELMRQQEQFGHTAESDDARDLYKFACRAGRHLRDMIEDASLHRLDLTQQHAVKLAAFAVAVAESCQRRLQAVAEPPVAEVEDRSGAEVSPTLPSPRT